MKNVETERKFLLKNIPKPNNKLKEIISIFQIYSNDKKTDFSERVRMSLITTKNSSELKFYHTTKKRISKLSQEEIENEINHLKFNSLSNLFLRNGGGSISKTRYVFKDGKLKWEVDKFDSINIIIAELEIPDENYKFVIPKYIKDEIISEVTGTKEFSNKNLCFKNKEQFKL